MDGISVIVIATFVFSVALIISPLIIWRNTNRTNRLLALMLLHRGVSPKTVRKAWGASGSSLSDIPGAEDTGLVGAAKEAGKTIKKTYSEIKNAAVEEMEERAKPVPPKFRFCPACGSDAPLDTTSCPSCTRILAEHPVHCPKCGHEITHQPAECPGCGTKYRYKGQKQ